MKRMSEKIYLQMMPPTEEDYRSSARRITDALAPTHGKVSLPVQTLRKLAEEKKIPHQMDVIRAGGTDAGEIHKTRSGVVTGAVSVPCRYTHTPVETVDTRDVEACADLIAAFCAAKLD